MGCKFHVAQFNCQSIQSIISVLSGFRALRFLRVDLGLHVLPVVHSIWRTFLRRSYSFTGSVHLVFWYSFTDAPQGLGGNTKPSLGVLYCCTRHPIIHQLESGGVPARLLFQDEGFLLNRVLKVEWPMCFRLEGLRHHLDSILLLLLRLSRST